MFSTPSHTLHHINIPELGVHLNKTVAIKDRILIAAIMVNITLCEVDTMVHKVDTSPVFRNRGPVIIALNMVLDPRNVTQVAQFFFQVVEIMLQHGWASLKNRVVIAIDRLLLIHHVAAIHHLGDKANQTIIVLPLQEAV